MGNKFVCRKCTRVGYTTARDPECPICDPPSKDEIKAYKAYQLAKLKYLKGEK